MDFTLIPLDKFRNLDKANQDYDIEILWYGLRSLVNNYFKRLSVGKQTIVEYIEEISNNLNSFQINKQYLEIYVEIYKFLIQFLKSYLVDFEATCDINNFYDYNLIETWLNRYNKIDYVKKIKVPYDYNSNATIKNLDKETIIYIKFVIAGVITKDKHDIELFKLFSSDFNKFMDYIVEHKIGKLFDIISCKFNLQEYYDYKKFNQKYLPIKFNKFIKAYSEYYKKN
jgi:hypothetical protein